MGRNRYYTEGSAARQMEAEPARRPDSKRRPKSRVRTEVTVKTRPVNMLSVMILGIALMATLYACIQYVQLQTEVTVRLKNINAYEVELTDLVSRNNETEAHINNYMDLQYIYQVATEELGMTYPDKSQVSEYESSISEYVRQYGAIPEVPKTGIGR